MIGNIDLNVWHSLPDDIRAELLLDFHTPLVELVEPDRKRQRNTMNSDIECNKSAKNLADWIIKSPNYLETKITGNRADLTQRPHSELLEYKKKSVANGMVSYCIDSERTTCADSVLFVDADFPPAAESIDGRRKVKLNPSVINNYNSDSAPKCLCKKSAKLKQVWKDGPNQGRYFYSCINNGCNYFSWGDNASHTRKTETMIWQRFLPSQGWILVSKAVGFSADDILQGCVGDCWFLSALSVIATRSDLIQNIIVSKSLNENGKLKFRLFIDGQWKEIEVDTFLPCQIDAKRNGKQSLVYSKAKHSQLWVPFLEKAYAKAHGSYHAICGGEISEALLDLTGAPSETIDFHHPSFESEDTWIRILSFLESCFPMGCATDSSGNGIVGHHAYSLLDAKELSAVNLGLQTSIDDFFQPGSRSSALQETQSRSQLFTDSGTLRVVRLRNPWGKHEWQGDLSAGSTCWTTKLKKLLDRGAPDDGTFWMSYHDFLIRFSCLEVCKAHLGGQWVGQSLEDFTSSNSSSLSCNSRFSMTVHHPTWMYLSLHQKKKRGDWSSTSNQSSGSSRYWYSDISMILSNSNNSNSSSSGDVLAASFNGARRLSKIIERQLSPGIYWIDTLHFNPPKESQSYVFRVYSSQPVTITQFKTNTTDNLNLSRILIRKSLTISHIWPQIELEGISSYLLRCVQQQVGGNAKDEEVSLKLLKGSGIYFLTIANPTNKRINIRVECCVRYYKVISSYLKNNFTQSNSSCNNVSNSNKRYTDSLNSPSIYSLSNNIESKDSVNPYTSYNIECQLSGTSFELLALFLESPITSSSSNNSNSNSNSNRVYHTSRLIRFINFSFESLVDNANTSSGNTTVNDLFKENIISLI